MFAGIMIAVLGAVVALFIALNPEVFTTRNYINKIKEAEKLPVFIEDIRYVYKYFGLEYKYFPDVKMEERRSHSRFKSNLYKLYKDVAQWNHANLEPVLRRRAMFLTFGDYDYDRK